MLCIIIFTRKSVKDGKLVQIFEFAKFRSQFPEKIYGKILEKCWENLGPDHYSARSCSVIRRSRDFIDLHLRAR